MMEVKGIAEKSQSEIREDMGGIFLQGEEDIMETGHKKGEAYSFLFVDALRVTLRCVQSDCLCSLILLPMIDDEKNRRSSQSCARRLHSLVSALTAFRTLTSG